MTRSCFGIGFRLQAQGVFVLKDPRRGLGRRGLGSNGVPRQYGMVASLGC